MESDCFLQSAKNAMRSVTTKSQKTIMAGLNCGTPSILAWEIMKSGIDLFISIDDSYAVQAMKKYYFPIAGDKNIEAGESGAAGLAGLMALLSDPKLNELRERFEIDSTTKALLFNTEGITDPDLFAEIVI
jgi:diaminopropionate ammonia-lyase